MNGRQFAILGMADYYLHHLDAHIAALPPRPAPRDPNRCQRAACGAEMGDWQRDTVPGVRWRQCTVCDYREQSRFDYEHYRRVLAARKDTMSNGRHDDDCEAS